MVYRGENNAKEKPMPITYKDLLFSKKDEIYEKHVGTAKRHNIDKTGVFYHVVTSTRAKEKIYYSDVANYRHNLLCKICEDKGVKIVFSLTMTNHTHDVLLTSDWEVLPEILRIVNLNVNKYIRRHYAEKIRRGRNIFAGDIAYIPIRDIRTLFYIGKYIQSNPDYMVEEGKIIPHTCFWMFERNYYPAPYDGTLYQNLFGMTGHELFELYTKLTRNQAYEYAKTHFRNWTEEKTHLIFYK